MGLKQSLYQAEKLVCAMNRIHGCGKTLQSTGKTMAFIFWDGINLTESQMFEVQNRGKRAEEKSAISTMKLINQ